MIKVKKNNKINNNNQTDQNESFTLICKRFQMITQKEPIQKNDLVTNLKTKAERGNNNQQSVNLTCDAFKTCKFKILPRNVAIYFKEITFSYRKQQSDKLLLN